MPVALLTPLILQKKKSTTKNDDYGISHCWRTWCPNDDTKNAKTRTGLAQDDPTRIAAGSSSNWQTIGNVPIVVLLVATL